MFVAVRQAIIMTGTIVHIGCWWSLAPWLNPNITKLSVRPFTRQSDPNNWILRDYHQGWEEDGPSSSNSAEKLQNDHRGRTLRRVILEERELWLRWRHFARRGKCMTQQQWQRYKVGLPPGTKGLLHAHSLQGRGKAWLAAEIFKVFLKRGSFIYNTALATHLQVSWKHYALCAFCHHIFGY